MKHLKYLWYIIRHKWFVLVAGLKVGAPIWRLLVHDLSKFRPSEWFPYTEYFYGKGKNLDAFNRAWLAHQHRNPHHWQHWLLREDDGGTIALRMSEPAMLEMIADWAGAGRAITGGWGVRAWYDKNRDNQLLHPGTRINVDYLIKQFEQRHFESKAL